MPRSPIVLLGGAPNAGTSTPAHAATRSLDVPWLSCDELLALVDRS